MNATEFNTAPAPSYAACIANWIRQLVRFRYGFLFVTCITLWVLVASAMAPHSIIANALKLDTYLQLTVLSAVNLVASVFSIVLLRILYDRYPPVRGPSWPRRMFGDRDAVWRSQQFELASCQAAVTPFLLSWRYGSEFSGWFMAGQVHYSDVAHATLSCVSILAGIAIGWGFLFLIANIKSFFFGSARETSNFFPFESVDRQGIFRFRKAIAKPDRIGPTRPEAIDMQLGVYLLLLVVTHYSAARSLPEFLPVLVSVPMVVVLIQWISFLVLIGLAYWLDKINLPVLLVLFVGMIVSNLAIQRPHTLKTKPDVSNANLNRSFAEIGTAYRSALETGSDLSQAVKTTALPLEEAAWRAIQQRMARIAVKDPNKRRVVVVVTCPGGGIHAAAWSSYVLEALVRKYPRFRDSVCVVSGVSGGSVGTLFFASIAYHPEITNDDRTVPIASAFELATESSLEQISIGLMTDGLYGTFLPPLSMMDRGQRLEDSFSSRLPEPQRTKTLNQWGDVALEGRMPVVVFNATDAVTGRRIIFDSIPTPIRISNAALTSRPYNYRELLRIEGNGFDLLPASGARASASFPYVSTFAKPDNGSVIGNGVAIGDGGYVDNEGIVTAIDWVQFLLERWASEAKATRPFDQILVLRIMPSMNGDSLAPPTSHWLVKNLRWLLGPIETIANVRSASQCERGNLETDLAALYLTSPTIDDEVSTSAFEIQTQSKVYSVNPDETFSKSSDKTREEGARTRYMDRLKRQDPERWNTVQENAEDREPKAATTAVVGPETYDPMESPVLVIEIPFELEDERHVIPLNWKLTRDQKTWYEEAWRRVESNQGEDMETMRKLFDGP